MSLPAKPSFTWPAGLRPLFEDGESAVGSRKKIGPRVVELLSKLRSVHCREKAYAPLNAFERGSYSGLIHDEPCVRLGFMVEDFIG